MSRVAPSGTRLHLTMNANQATVIKSLASGLNGYLLKDAEPEDVLRHPLGRWWIAGRRSRSQGRGGHRCHRCSARGCAGPARRAGPRDPGADGPGPPASQVAARLYLAPKTIRNRVSDMIGKLGVSTREEAIVLGRAAGVGRAG